jgi:hypothetical protein
MCLFDEDRTAASTSRCVPQLGPAKLPDGFALHKNMEAQTFLQ